MVDSVIQMAAQGITFHCRRLITPRADHQPGELRVADGRVAYAGPPQRGTPGAIGIDGTVCPGLVDLQVNGWGRHSVLEASPSAIADIATGLLADGVTAWLPTIISAPESDRLAALDAVREAADASKRPRTGARVVGVHLEGPWISPVRAGAHDPETLRRPDEMSLAQSLDRHPGLVKMVTLAPELPGGLDAVRQINGAGAVASIGHSDASFDESVAAFDAGVRAATHLWNAMRPFHHRDPGVAGAVLLDQRVVAGLIADGVHVHPSGVALAFRAKGAGRIALVSDLVEGGRGGRDAARRPDGILAGAFDGLGRGLAVAVSAGVAPCDAVHSATLVPADLLRLPVGRLDPGSPADFVVLDADFRPRATYLGGREAWRR